MHTFTLLSVFLTSTVLAVPHAQYGLDPEGGPASRPAPSTSLVDVFASPNPIEWVSASETLLSTTQLPVTTSFVTITASSVSNSSIPVATLSSLPSEISSLIPSATSTPLPQAGVYICEDVNWGGECKHIFSNPTSSPSDCIPLDGSASSIGPDEGFECFFFTNAYCRPLLSDGSDFVLLAYPGEKNMLETSQGDLNDKIYSYFCLPAA